MSRNTFIKQQNAEHLSKVFKGYGTYLGAIAPLAASIPGAQVAAPILTAGSALHNAIGDFILTRAPKVVNASPGFKIKYSYGGQIDPQRVLSSLLSAAYVLPSSKGVLVRTGPNSAKVKGSSRITDSEKFFVPYA